MCLSQNIWKKNGLLDVNIKLAAPINHSIVIVAYLEYNNILTIVPNNIPSYHSSATSNPTAIPAALFKEEGCTDLKLMK